MWIKKNILDANNVWKNGTANDINIENCQELYTSNIDFAIYSCLNIVFYVMISELVFMIIN